MKKIAIIGNPNCGKTTIFNELTGARQIIGNWPGVTVERKEGFLNFENQKIQVIDLPGIYSLSAKSDDEKVSLDFILNGGTDLFLNVIDASNIQRNLYLTTQLIEMNIPMIIVMNRHDIAINHNLEINTEEFSKHLKIPVIAINSHDKEDVYKLKKLISVHAEKPDTAAVKIDYPDEIENIISELEKALECGLDRCFENKRWAAIKLLEKDFYALSRSGFDQKEYDHFQKNIFAIEKLHKETTDIIIADYRFGFIKGLYEHAVKRKSDKRQRTEIIDKAALSGIFGLPIFLFIMYLVFKFTIDIGSSLISFFDIISAAIITKPLEMLSAFFSFPDIIQTILVSGVGVGIQSVMTFVPIIFCMFLSLSILEDSGYMARAAFVMDKFMQKIGLPGKSFVPMIVGFGCSVPAVMASRTLESRKDRIVTIFLIPLMSCGARLPVYALFAAVFFPENAALAVFSLYAVGILFAVLTGFLFKKAVYKNEISHFVMELPVYNFPRPKHIFIHTWNRLKVFMLSAGKVIIIGSVILAVLNSAGHDFSFSKDRKGDSLLTYIGKKTSIVLKPMGITEENWPATVAVFTGVFSKEAVIGTLNSLYSQMDETEETASIPEMIKSAFASIPEYFSQKSDDESSALFAAKAKFSNGKLSVYAYLLFILIYFPCIATLGAIVGEIGWKGAALSVTYLTMLAWSVSSLFYQLTSGHDIVFISASVSIILLIITAFILAGKIISRDNNNADGKNKKLS